MMDCVFVAGSLLLFFFLGVPFTRLFGSDVRGRALASPVLGSGVFGIASTVLYGFGLRPQYSAGLAVVAAIILIRWWLADRRRQSPKKPSYTNSLCWICLAVTLLCLAPKWSGGQQFWALQGNADDQLNYIAGTAAMRSHSFHELLTLPLAAPVALDNDYVLFGKQLIAQRPTIEIVLAALASIFHMVTPAASYAYLVLMQVLMWFGATFVLMNCFAVRDELCAFVAGALTLGFFEQYVLDINAWSELAALPITMLLIMAIVMGLKPGDKVGDAADVSPTRAPRRPAVPQPAQRHEETVKTSSKRWFSQSWVNPVLLIAILFSSTIYYYPECVFPILAACGGVIALVVVFSRFDTRVLKQVALIAAALVLGTSVCLLFWNGTVGHAWRQARFASNPVLSAEWYKYFQKYLLPYDANYGTTHHGTFLSRLYSIVSEPIDCLISAVGLFFIRPRAIPSSIVLRLVVEVVLGLGLVWLFASAGRTLWQLWQKDGITNRTVCFLLIALVANAVPVALLLMGMKWTAGKALSMMGPLLFILLVAPALRGRERIFWRVPALTLAVLHVAFGLYRPIAAHDPSGIHYSPAFYPSINNPLTKTELSWDVERWRSTLQSCHDVGVSIDNNFLDRYTQIYLSELGIPWTTLTPVNRVSQKMRGNRPAPERFNCLVTTRGEYLVRPRDKQTVIWLGRGVSAVSVTPNSGIGFSQTFRYAYADAEGYTAIESAHAMVNTTVQGRSSCWVVYYAGSNTLYLANDTASGWFGPLIPGSSGILQNSQCILSGYGSAAHRAGRILTVDLNFTFKSEFQGTKSAFGFVQNNSGQNSGWQTLGSWIIGRKDQTAGM